MKRTISATIIFLLLAVVAYSQNNFVGRWVGTYGNGTQENPNYYSFQFNGDGTLQLYNQSHQVIANGSYQVTGSQFTGTYNYTSSGTFSVSGSVDASGSLRGTWGSGSNASGGGHWVMNKNQIAVVSNVTAGTNRSLIGRWIGTWGSGSQDTPNYFSFLFNQNNVFQLLDASGAVIANGNYTLSGTGFSATYTYTAGGTYSVSGSQDAAGILNGSWGSGNNTSNGGKWKMTGSQNGNYILPAPITQTIAVFPGGNTNQHNYNFSNVRMCIDRVVNTGFLPDRNFSAVKPLPKINSDGSFTTTGAIRQPLAAETNKMWDPGQTINVFIENTASEFVRQKVRFYAAEWEKHANIKFAFVNDRNNANIKVGFVNDNTSWSMVGKDALFNPLGVNTMNFGWFDDATAESEFRATIQHEFGHALGFIHEHQSPAAGIAWDKEKVYAFFGGEPTKWSRAEVNNNVFNKYSRTSINFSSYDRLSIMHYSFPAYLTTDGSSFPMNTDFSSIDKQYSRLIYPFPPTPSNANGVLRTGDDCDEISFSVEYNAVDPNNVEFVLSLGNANGKTVTWWKQIGIPRTNNTETPIWVQNHSLIASENRTGFSQQIPFIEIDRSKGISFWKGKIAGVHTLLGYKWNILPCITGGCRIRLTWNKDSCL
jgi:hypothetical protein